MYYYKLTAGTKYLHVYNIYRISPHFNNKGKNKNKKMFLVPLLLLLPILLLGQLQLYLELQSSSVPV